MGKLTAKQVESKSKGAPGRHADGDGLYFVVPKSGKSYWMLRYTSNKKRKEMTLGKLLDLSLADARLEAAIKMKQLREGADPLLLKRRSDQSNIVTVDDLFLDWYKSLVKRLKHPKIPERIYRKEMAPFIGDAKVSIITPKDVREILHRIVSSNRPTIANDALMYCKQLFNHGIKLDVITFNPASAFSVVDAGGVEKSKDRALTVDELQKVFEVFRENNVSFARDNYLACALLVLLGVRKGELTAAPWSEFDLEKGVWSLSEARSKSGVGLDIPLPKLALKWFQELKVRSCGSDYVFPNRRGSQQPHMGADTLNRAITKLFGHEAGRKKQPPNKMGDLAHFTVHDLRRTCRTLLAAQGTPGHVAERCLNHKLKGVEGIYDRHDYFEERLVAMNDLAKCIEPIIEPKTA